NSKARSAAVSFTRNLAIITRWSAQGAGSQGAGTGKSNRVVIAPPAGTGIRRWGDTVGWENTAAAASTNKSNPAHPGQVSLHIIGLDFIWISRIGKWNTASIVIGERQAGGGTAEGQVQSDRFVDAPGRSRPVGNRHPHHLVARHVRPHHYGRRRLGVRALAHLHRRARRGRADGQGRVADIIAVHVDRAPGKLDIGDQTDQGQGRNRRGHGEIGAYHASAAGGPARRSNREGTGADSRGSGDGDGYG